MSEATERPGWTERISESVNAAKRRERAVRVLLFAAASVALVVTGAIIYTLVQGSVRFVGADVVTVSAFFGHPNWGGIASVIAGAVLALVASEGVLYLASHVLDGLTGAKAPSVSRRLSHRLVSRWALVLTAPIVFLAAGEGLGGFLPAVPGLLAGVQTASALAYLWIASHVAGDVLPTQDLPGRGVLGRVLVLALGGLVVAALMGPLGAVLGYGQLGTSDFLGSVTWAGIAGEFSIWPLISGTMLVAGGSLALAGPLGVGAALYLAEFAGPRTRAIGKPLVEILAGIPSIVYGFFALFTISPWMQDTFGAMTYNAGSAIIVVSVMVLPIVVSLSDDAISSVPDDLRDASLAMGATEWETSLNVILPAARSGVFASLFLGLARALGETMAVMLAAGSIARWHFDPLTEVQTMTTYIGRVSTGDIPPGPAVDAAFAVGLILFVITYTVNLSGQEILDRMGVEGS
jgi:phosphate transport system permease protein